MLLREKALHIATRLGSDGLKASNGWLNGVKQQQQCVQNCGGRRQKWGNEEGNSYSK
jgi:hypothetical protein